MAGDKKEDAQPQQREMSWSVKLPIILLGVILGLMLVNYMAPTFFSDFKTNLRGIFGVGGAESNDPFVGTWNTASPAAYYSQDIDGERYVDYKANFLLIITRENKGYLGNGWITDVTYTKVPGAMTPITPLVSNPGGGYASPLSFDARGYLEPQPGISSLQMSDDKKTMTITTPLSGGSEKIVLRLSGDEKTLYASLSVIPTSSGSAMGEETDSDIVLLKRVIS